MKTVQMTLDEDLVSEVDAMAHKLGTTRSAFARDALRAALARRKDEQREAKHRKGYRRKPVGSGEFDVDESDRAWGDP